MSHDCQITRNVRDRQDAVLRIAETRGMTLSLLAAETEIPADTLASYRRTNSREPSVMPLVNFIKVAKVLVERGHGDLASLLIEDTGCGLQPRDPEAANLFAVGSAASGLASLICEAASDGRFDHQEKAQIKRKAGPLMAMLQDVTAGGGAAGES
jgi:hypothetical protein